MVKKLLVLFLILIGMIIYLTRDTNTITTTTQKIAMDQYLEQKENLFGIIEIPSLNLKQPIYPIGSKENNVDQNIMLLEQTDHLLALASHSGNGPHAYFQKLSNISFQEPIKIIKGDETKEYHIWKMEEVKKTGTILIEEYNFPYLVLITCSKTKNQIQEVYYAK